MESNRTARLETGLESKETSRGSGMVVARCQFFESSAVYNLYRIQLEGYRRILSRVLSQKRFLFVEVVGYL